MEGDRDRHSTQEGERDVETCPVRGDVPLLVVDHRISFLNNESCTYIRERLRGRMWQRWLRGQTVGVGHFLVEERHCVVWNIVYVKWQLLDPGVATVAFSAAVWRLEGPPKLSRKVRGRRCLDADSAALGVVRATPRMPSLEELEGHDRAREHKRRRLSSRGDPYWDADLAREHERGRTLSSRAREDHKRCLLVAQADEGCKPATDGVEVERSAARYVSAVGPLQPPTKTPRDDEDDGIDEEAECAGRKAATGGVDTAEAECGAAREVSAVGPLLPASRAAQPPLLPVLEAGLTSECAGVAHGSRTRATSDEKETSEASDEASSSESDSEASSSESEASSSEASSSDGPGANIADRRALALGRGSSKPRKQLIANFGPFFALTHMRLNGGVALMRIRCVRYQEILGAPPGKSKSVRLNLFELGPNGTPGWVPTDVRNEFAHLYLRAWMLWRSGGRCFLGESFEGVAVGARRRSLWHAAETARLKEDLDALAQMAALPDLLVRMVRIWAPATLPAGT